MAEVMNTSPKVVFSKQLLSAQDEPNWKNIRVFHHIDVEEIRTRTFRNGIALLRYQPYSGEQKD